MIGERAACLLLATGPRRTAVWLRRSTAVLGRSGACDLVIQEPGVARRHPVGLRAGAGPPVVPDHCAPRGVLLNGRRVDRAELSDGDVIGIGDARVVYLLGLAPRGR